MWPCWPRSSPGLCHHSPRPGLKVKVRRCQKFPTLARGPRPLAAAAHSILPGDDPLVACSPRGAAPGAPARLTLGRRGPRPRRGRSLHAVGAAAGPAGGRSQPNRAGCTVQQSCPGVARGSSQAPFTLRRAVNTKANPRSALSTLARTSASSIPCRASSRGLGGSGGRPGASASSKVSPSSEPSTREHSTRPVEEKASVQAAAPATHAGGGASAPTPTPTAATAYSARSTRPLPGSWAASRYDTSRPKAAMAARAPARP
mmetsp:Transcript_10806/g.36680  ORF Transcript_10806/g.36680 Transcript_10806/m.36680 type:complete len:259 (-) Transcript_10806:216-992(-)